MSHVPDYRKGTEVSSVGTKWPESMGGHVYFPKKTWNIVDKRSKRVDFVQVGKNTPYALFQLPLEIQQNSTTSALDNHFLAPLNSVYIPVCSGGYLRWSVTEKWKGWNLSFRVAPLNFSLQSFLTHLPLSNFVPPLSPKSSLRTKNKVACWMGKQRLWDLRQGGSVAVKQGLIAAKFCHVCPSWGFLQILLRMCGSELRSRHRESTARKYIQENIN